MLSYFKKAISTEIKFCYDMAFVFYQITTILSNYHYLLDQDGFILALEQKTVPKASGIIFCPTRNYEKAIPTSPLGR